MLVAIAASIKGGGEAPGTAVEIAKTGFYWIGRVAAVFLLLIGVLLLVLIAVCGTMIAKM